MIQNAGCASEVRRFSGVGLVFGLGGEDFGLVIITDWQLQLQSVVLFFLGGLTWQATSFRKRARGTSSPRRASTAGGLGWRPSFRASGCHAPPPPTLARNLTGRGRKP